MAHAVAASLVALAVAAAQTSTSSPDAFLRGIYEPYLQPGFKGIDTSTPAKLRRYFDGCLADAIEKDFKLSKENHELPFLNGDLFTYLQEFGVSDLRIRVSSLDDRRASGTVTFRSYGEPRMLVLHLVKTGSGWRIVDMESGGRLLSHVLAQANGSAKCLLTQ